MTEETLTALLTRWGPQWMGWFLAAWLFYRLAKINDTVTAALLENAGAMKDLTNEIKTAIGYFRERAR